MEVKWVRNLDPSDTLPRTWLHLWRCLCPVRDHIRDTSPDHLLQVSKWVGVVCGISQPPLLPLGWGKWGDCRWPLLPRGWKPHLLWDSALAISGHICWFGFPSPLFPFPLHKNLSLRCLRTWKARSHEWDSLLRVTREEGEKLLYLPHERNCVLKASVTYLWNFGTLSQGCGSLSPDRAIWSYKMKPFPPHCDSNCQYFLSSGVQLGAASSGWEMAAQSRSSP